LCAIGCFKGYAKLFVVALAPLVTACAGTQVSNLAGTMPGARIGPPHTVAVVVENDSPPPEKPSRREQQLVDARQTVAALTESLSAMLAKRQLVAVSAGQPSDIVLRCRIVDVRGGNQALRMIIGFGAGKAILRTDVSLHDRAGHTFVSFETNSTTGRMPGPGLGLASSGVGLARSGANAMTVAGVAGGGLGVVGGLKQGLAQEVRQTTNRIDEELGKFFKAQKWPYAIDSASSSSLMSDLGHLLPH
jgi:hypothetical protein